MVPTLLHGSETSDRTNKNVGKIESVETSRKVNVFDKTKNEGMRNQLNV
jgi:hypothetical protein